MKEGFRIYDTDTHIDPGADVLEKYVDPGFRERLDDLAPYRVAIKSRSVDGGVRHTYRFESKRYERTLGEAESRPGSPDGRVWRGERRPSPGVVDDRSDNRVFDMDAEGSDVHFLVPSVWTSVVGLPDVSLEIGLIRAYHRHMQEFCGPFPDRLKGPIVASTRDVARGGARNPRMGQVEMGGRGAALARQRPAGRSPRPRTDLARRRGARFGDRAPQLYLVAALFPRLRGHVGQCLSGAAVLASLGSDAVHGRVSRRRDFGPLSGAAALRPRMRVWLAAVLGAADGRAGQLCRPHRQIKTSAERAFRRRAGVLQHRGA